MKKLGKKIDGVLDAIYGTKIKGRWIKVLATIFILVTMVVVPVFLSTNLGYTKKDGFFLKPWDVKIDVKKSVK